MLRILTIVCLTLPLISWDGLVVGWLLQPEHWPQLALVIGVLGVTIPSILRREPALDRWTRSLIALLAVVLFSAFLSGSIWLHTSALGIGLTLASGHVEPARRCRGRCFVVLLVCISGLPSSWSAPPLSVVHGQMLGFISTICGLLNLWHYHDQQIFETVNGTLDATAVLHSPLGFAGLYTLTAGIMLACYRSTIQILLAMPTTALTAWLTQTLACICAIADLSDGELLLDPTSWLLCQLPLTAGLLWSGIQLNRLLTHAIIPPDRNVSEALLENRLCRLWDHFVGGRPIEVTGPIQLLSSPSAEHPDNLSVTDFFRDLLHSRRLFLLPSAVPALLLPMIAVVPTCVQRATHSTVLAEYENAANTAEQAGNRELQYICLRQLAALEPQRPVRQIRLASYIYEHESRQVGWESFLKLASPPNRGLPEAHLWIAEHALANDPTHRLSRSQITAHLQNAVESPEVAARAHVLLGYLHIQHGEKQLAERHFRSAVSSDLKHTDDLILALAHTGRVHSHEKCVELRLAQLKSALTQRPENIPLRIRFAVLLTALGELFEAENTIDEGRRLHDTPELQAAAGDLLCHKANSELNSYTRTGDISLTAVRRAIEVHPGSIRAPVLASQLTIEGADLSEDVEPALNFWRQRSTTSADQATFRSLAHLSFAANRQRECLDYLERLTNLANADRRVKIKALMQLGQREEALATAWSSLVNPHESPSTETAAAVADFLGLAHAFIEARSYIQKAIAAGCDADRMRLALGKTAISELDVLLGLQGPYQITQTSWQPAVAAADAQRIADLIEMALRIPQITPYLADRLILLTTTDSEIAQQAVSVLEKFRAAGGNTYNTLFFTGCRALQFEKHDDALKWLDLAAAVCSKDDPVLWNNLAVAIVRTGKGERYPEALQYADRAVKAMPENHQPFTTRGEVYLALGNPRLAIQDLETAIRMQPEDPESTRLLAQAWLRLGEPEQAEKYHRRAETLNRGRL